MNTQKIAAEILKMSKDNMTANRIQMLWDHYKKDVNMFVDKVNETVKTNALSMVADKGWLLRFLENLTGKSWTVRGYELRMAAKQRVLTKEERQEMMNDAHRMNATTWYKKYPIGDYDDYKNMYKRQYENMIGGGYPFASTQKTIKCARSFKSLDDFKSEIAKSAHAVEAEFKGDTYYVLAKLSSDKYLNIEEYVSEDGTIDYVGSTNEYNQRSSTGWVPFNTKELKSTIKDYLSHSKTSPMKLIEVLK